MKKKVLSVLACAIILCAFMLLFASCGENEPAHTHNYSTLKFDNESHWFECECEEKNNIVSHNIKNGECACGYIVPHTHEYSILKNDATEHWYECICGDKANAATHNGGTLTCTQSAKCVVCGEEYGSPLNHAFGEPIYTWFGDICTATRICERDNSHIEMESVIATYTKDADSTSTAAEKGHYTASFTNIEFSTQSITAVDEYDDINKKLIATGNGYPKSATKYLTIDNENKKHITLGDITEGGYYIIDTTWIVSDLPAGVQQGKISGLHVERHGSNYDDVAFVKQTGYSITGATVLQYWRCTNVRGEWSQWSVLSAGDVVNNTYNNEIVTNVQTNNYTVNVAPAISTNTNNFLASTNNSDDRTLDIVAMLETTGFCQLGPGEFYVANLHMPSGTTLVGSGYSTILLLDESVEDGYAIRISSNCTVRDMRISSPTTISLSKNIGTRHGIVFQGTYNTDGNSGGKYMSLSNLYLDNFTGGGITCYNTGYSPSSSIGATDVTITKCTVGINLSYWSEYHRFTNVYCNSCYYGCINNGGNNMFVNCGFNSNKFGFVIDNSNGDKPNNAHGSAVGCTFNHQNTNDNPGYAITIINTSAGFVFEGCQIFYGKTLLKNSSGVTFTGCNFGSNESIEIEGGGTILYNGCMFGSAPKISVINNDSTYFVNCYLRKGGVVQLNK